MNDSLGHDFKVATVATNIHARVAVEDWNPLKNILNEKFTETGSESAVDPKGGFFTQIFLVK